MSKIKYLQIKAIAISILTVLFIQLALPVFADHSAEKTTCCIMSFDNSQGVAHINKKVEQNLPDFFIIHGSKNENFEFSKMINENYSRIRYNDNSDDSIQNVIYHKNSYEVLRSKTIWLTGTPVKKSKTEGSKTYQTCTYALFSSKENGKNIAIFASGVDNNEKAAKKQAMYLFSKFQCYRDYYPTVLSVKCADVNNVNIFNDKGLSCNLLSKNGLNIFASESVKKLSELDCGVKFDTEKSPKQLNTNGKFIALTFDDGPTRLKGRTDKILESIQKYNVKATFFVLGSRISDDNPVEQQLLKKERSLGCEIGNHTYNHDSYAKLKDIKSIERQINETDLLIEKICGGSYATLLRPPGGIVNDKQDLDRPIINWCIDTTDWSSKQTVKGIIDTVKKDAGNGKIVLMHDINTKSSTAIDEVIGYLLENGYNLVTVSELMEFCDVDMWAGYIYTDANHEKRTTFCN